MKKTIMILLVLIMMSISVFATPSNTIVLTTAIGGKSKGGFTTDTVTSYAQNVGSVADGQEVSANVIGNYKVYYQSNEKKKITLILKATPFKATGIDTKIGYSLKVNGTTLTPTKSSDASIVVAHITNTHATGASYAFSNYAINSNDEKLAVSSAEYKSTLTLTISVS